MITKPIITGDIELIKHLADRHENIKISTWLAIDNLPAIIMQDPEMQQIIEELHQHQEYMDTFTDACKQAIANHAFNTAKEALNPGD